MKTLLILLFFSTTLFGQTEEDSIQNLSVISAEKLNIVYRGINNPIKIAVPGATSFIATAPGLSKNPAKGEGNYLLKPGPGTKIFITVVAKMPDGKSKAEKKSFIIKDIPNFQGTVTGDACDNCIIFISKNELKKAKVRSIINMPFISEDEMDFFEVKAFDIIFKKKSIHVEGNTMSAEAIKLIDKLKIGSLVYIHLINVESKYPNVEYPHYRRPLPILLQISEEHKLQLSIP